MSYDPYAPPRDPQQTQAQWGQQAGGPVPWNAADAIGRGWEIYKAYALVLSLVMFVTFLLGEIPAGLDQAAESLHWTRGGAKIGFSLGMTLAGWIVEAWLEGGILTAMLKAVRGEKPSFADAFSGGRWFLRILVSNFLMRLLILLGFLLLIVPGIIASLGLMLAPLFIVEQDMGAVESLSASWTASKGQKGDLFLLTLLSVLVLALGMCVLGFGFFVALPVVQLATCIAYVSITGRGAPAGPPAAPPPPVAPMYYVP